MNKIVTREFLVDLFKSERLGQVGFTSGSFDLLHAGHVDYLTKAKEYCDCLVVGVNSDSSVREYKSDLRPIVPQDQRAKVVAGLESVNYVFIFDETNNNKNIELLRPNCYIKAGDYNKEQLSSAEIVESYGGEVILIDVIEEISSSDIINTVLEKYTAQNQAYIPKDPLPPAKGLILDRDGTIIKQRDYLMDPEYVELLPGVGEGIKKFQDEGYRVCIITNQPGIDFGYMEMEKMFQVNKRMLAELNKFDIQVHKIYFSPYTQAAETDCRKPGTALIKRAEKELNLNLSESMVIGDAESDIQMGASAGTKTALITSEKQGESQADFQVDNILELYENCFS